MSLHMFKNESNEEWNCVQENSECEGWNLAGELWNMVIVELGISKGNSPNILCKSSEPEKLKLLSNNLIRIIIIG